MTTFLFPTADKKYIQTNRSDVAGNMVSSFGNDFQSNVGVLRISPRLLVNTNTADASGLNGYPVAFKYFDNQMWAIAGTNIFQNNGDLLTTSFVQNASTNVPTTFFPGSDMEVVGGTLGATDNASLWKKSPSNGVWAKVGDLTEVNSMHKVAYFKQQDRLYILDNYDQVDSADGSLSSLNLAADGDDFTLDITGLGSNAPGALKYTAQCIVASSSFVWLGTTAASSNDLSNRGSIIQWDGISTVATNEYRTSGHGVPAMIVGDDDVPYAVDTNGALLKYTGSGFHEVGRLPVLSGKLLQTLNAGTNIVYGQFIDANGLTITKNGTILALVNGMNMDGTQNEFFASGIYEFDLNGGCEHKYAFTYTHVGGTTITDYGQNQIQVAGALLNISNLNTVNLLNPQVNVIAGINYFTSASASTHGIFVDNFPDDIQKKGYVVTTWLESEQIADDWNAWWMSYRQFLDAGDSITLKYRNTKVAPAQGTITWVDTTHFTIPNSSVDVSQYWTADVGGEVEILRGTGSGSCAHIINAVLATGTWTVTLDETITGVTTGTAIARFQHWIKIFPANPLDFPLNWANFAFNADASQPRMQVKMCFKLTGEGEFYKAMITSNTDITSKSQ